VDAFVKKNFNKTINTYHILEDYCIRYVVEIETVSLTVGIRYKPGYTGILVGQCKEFPLL
jgi:hypothetical protein